MLSFRAMKKVGGVLGGAMRSYTRTTVAAAGAGKLADGKVTPVGQIDC